MKEIICLVFIMFLLIGCNSGNESGSNQGKEPKQEGAQEEMQESKPLTKEFIMEKYGFAEEDLADYDVEKIVEFYGFTEENIRDTSKSNILGVLAYYLEKLETDKIARAKSKEYLMEAGPYTGEELDESGIKYLAFLSNENDAMLMYFVDFGSKKAYYSMTSNLFADLETAEMVGVVEDKDINELVKLLEKANIQNWIGSYQGTNRDSTGAWYWQLGMEFADGIIVTYEGNGIYGDNQPKGFERIEEKIWNMAYLVKVDKDSIEEN